MFPTGPVRAPHTPFCGFWMSSSPLLAIALAVEVPYSARAVLRLSRSVASSPFVEKLPNKCWPKSMSVSWGFGDRCKGKVSSSVGVRCGEVSRPLKMYSINRDRGHATSRVLGTEQSVREEEGVSEKSEVDTLSNGLDCVTEEFHVMCVTESSIHAGENVEPTLSDDGSAEVFSSDGSCFSGNVEESTGGGEDIILPGKRDFCKRCCKAASRCICRLFTTQVNNKTGIIILQHPLENNHHLGTARIAVVGLRNVELISVPEGDEQISCRLRPKVPGSKRQIVGRGGKKAQFLAAQAQVNKKLPRKRPAEPKRQTEATIQVKHETEGQSFRPSADSHVMKMATLGTKRVEQDPSTVAVPSWINLQPDAGLLFPSEHAVDLDAVGSACTPEEAGLFENDNLLRGSAHRPPSQLIVLDGTWSKAKRIFYENPWLHSLPHYRLPSNDGASRYGIIRKEPKPGCMSTIESIVLALRTLEPETEGLDNLLVVFDLMIADQKSCMGEKYAELEAKFRNGRPLRYIP